MFTPIMDGNRLTHMKKSAGFEKSDKAGNASSIQ